MSPGKRRLLEEIENVKIATQESWENFRNKLEAEALQRDDWQNEMFQKEAEAHKTKSVETMQRQLNTQLGDQRCFNRKERAVEEKN